MITSNEKSTEELQEIIQWYADKVYYDMTDAIEEIEWLIDNLKPKAFQEIVDFYEYQTRKHIEEYNKHN